MQGTVKHQKSIIVWGCFSWNCVGDLHWVKGMMTGPVYRQIFSMITIQNTHSSGMVQRYLANKKVTVMKWPAQSPELNPIENLWPQLNRITMERKPTNEEELFEVLKRGWESLSIEYLHGLIEFI